jgi:hypothetical protein
VFWDGVGISPSISTTNARIEERLRDCINGYGKGLTPGVMAAEFVAISVAEGFGVGIHSLPQQSTGGTISYIQRPDYWPREGNAGGVFLVHTETGETQYWGGDGLRPEEGFNPGVPRKAFLKDVEIIDDGAHD